MIPTVQLTTQDIQNQTFPEKKLDKICQLFSQKGCLLIENAFPKKLIHKFYEAYIEEYKCFFHEKNDSQTLKVGQKRIMITLDLRPPFNTPIFYANPFVMPILQNLLGDRMVLGSIGSVVSLPGDEDQHQHRDNPGLFDSPLDALLPSYAINMFIPLVQFNKHNGTTKVWPESHRNFTNPMENSDDIDPIISVGSCMLVDYRLYHGGTANHSSFPRPLLYNVYHRAWYRDTYNFQHQPSRQISNKEIDKIPARYRSLFSASLSE